MKSNLIEIQSHKTGAVIFTAAIEADDNTSAQAKMGLAVRAAVKIKADLNGADLIGADLIGADLRDAYLRDADLREANLREANLSGAYLRGVDLRCADLRGANLREAYMSWSDLSGADLRGADLRGAYLNGADLSWSDLSGADLDMAPAIENIHAKVYAAASQPGALVMNEWHCGTSHCRAGWVITLAGEEGAKLEAEIGTPAAATAIYIASDPDRWKVERLPDFLASNKNALADMQRMAEAAQP